MTYGTSGGGLGRPTQTPSGRQDQGAGETACYAALDLGTNNCRLLIAAPTREGFRVVEAFSRIVRLGDGLSRTGQLDPAAMDRAVAALGICADKIRRRRPLKVRAVATQACRIAENGAAFVERVAAETGIRLDVITTREEAKLSVAGCANLLDRNYDAALVVDVGGGSTELSWVDLTASGGVRLVPGAWLSIPAGVVTLAERFPEDASSTEAWYEAMVDHIRKDITAFRQAERFRPVFEAGRAHLIGTSGAITSLAGMHLGLRRYERSRVDGLWLSDVDCDAAAEQLIGLGPGGRAAEPCIGPDRADLVLAGAAILRAVQDTWPCRRVRVADRGLREGILLSMMAEARGGGRRRRRRRPKPPARQERMVRPPSGGDPAGRGFGARLKTADKRSLSSQQWLERQLNDPFVKAAHAKGYRSRAAFKLTEIDDRFHLLKRGARVIDLGCAPGGWLQVAVERGAGAVAGVDLLPVDPIAGAGIIQADFTDPGVGERLVEMIGGPPDLVLSDMAPNTSGHRQTDHLRIVGLIEAAADFAVRRLRPGGAFVAKAFQGGETAEAIRTLKASFADVRHVKPKASRADSAEVYLVATDLKR
jgi:exopolyphosphatase / guanosine-5'-triphosphate,3'-diphosphate pyrophosphatase